jgi:hypothetical protein
MKKCQWLEDTVALLDRALARPVPPVSRTRFTCAVSVGKSRRNRPL